MGIEIVSSQNLTPELSCDAQWRRVVVDATTKDGATKRRQLERPVMPQQVEQPNRGKHNGSRGQEGQSAQPSRSLHPRAGKSWLTRWQRGRKLRFASARALVGRMETQGPSGRRTERRRQRRAARIGTDRSDLSAASFTPRSRRLAACAKNQHKPCEAEA